MEELAAWILFPLIALTILTGVGRLAARACGVAVEPAVVPALGLATAIAVLGPLCATGLGAWPAPGLLIVLAVAGFALDRRLPLPRWGGVAGGLTYALYIAPVALSGQATFLGYNLLNDTSIHFALVDWIEDHGARYHAGPASSYSSAIQEYVGSHYPLGSHEILAALRPLSGLDVALVYQPFLALSAAVAAAAIAGLLRAEGVRAHVAAAAGLAALGSQLAYSFSLQGGIKELTFVACLAAAAAVAAQLVHSERPAPAAVLLALTATALYGIYGIYALPWIGPLALVAAWLAWRAGTPVRPALVASTIAFAAAAGVLIPGSIEYLRHGSDVLTSGNELGPLGRPLKLLQAAGVWLNGDYRFPPSPHSWITYFLAALVVVLAATGALLAVRRRRAAILLLLVPPLVALAATAPLSSPYIDAKLLAVLSPALVVAACIGIGAVHARVPRAGLAVAVVLGAGLLVSDALAYRMALLAPVDRLDELSDIDDRFAGEGPVLVNEFESYVKHYMRRSRGSIPYEKWTAGLAELRDPDLPVSAHAYELDRMKSSFVQRWPLIALRRSPTQSRPPSNYTREFRGRFYEVWRRTGPAPAAHIPLRRAPFDPTAPLLCDQVRRLERRGHVVAAIRNAPLAIRIDQARLPPGWYRNGQDRHALDVRKGGALVTEFEGAGRGRLWLRGRAFRRDRVVIDGRPVGVARGANGPAQWIETGPVSLGPGRHELVIRRPLRSLRPGDAQTDVIGPFAIATDDVRLVSGNALHALCGATADWVELRR